MPAMTRSNTFTQSTARLSIRRSAQAFLSIFFLVAAFLGQVRVVEAQSARPAQQASFAEFGFEVSGFTAAQEQVIRQTLEGYARALGSPEKLRQIITTYSGGKNRKITYNPDRVGARTAMELGPTVFSLEQSLEANYSSYGTADEAAHAQIVIGHEIGHLLLWAAEERTGVDWIAAYQQRVRRDWAGLHPTAPMEEGATNLSLKAAQLGYFFSLEKNKPEADLRASAAIDTWAADFLAALRQLD
jgi:hypothetical protein